MKEAPAPRDVVFVVHGANVHTWWRRLANGGYSWWRSWSLFCDALRTTFGRDATIRDFRWSGRNAHDARLEAGMALARVIGALPEETRLHLVAHSHGGNVALVAINHLSPQRVTSLVLLANPHVILFQQNLPVVPYWGDAHARVGHIWNLFSESDFIQTRGAQWRHGFEMSAGTHVRVSRVYEGPGQDAVHNHAIGWKTTFGAHRAMHSSAVGSLAGGLLRLASFEESLRGANLRADALNRIPDRGGYGGTEWAYQRIRERGNPASFDIAASNHDIALLMVHGFTASPSEMRPLADFLVQRTGWRCRAVLLPGHGTHIADMEGAGTNAWLDAVQSTLMELAAQCRHVFLVGLSLGAVLCCHVAMSERHRVPNLRGIVLMAPAFAIAASRARALHFLRFFRKRRPKGPQAVHYFLEHKLFSYPELPLDRAVEVLRMGRHAWDNLDKLKGMPTLLIAGEQDRNVSVPHMIRAAEQHPWIEFVRLPRSRHILTVEPDQTTAFEAILSFVNRSAIER